MTELKIKEMQLINWFGCPNLIYTRAVSYTHL